MSNATEATKIIQRGFLEFEVLTLDTTGRARDHILNSRSFDSREKAERFAHIEDFKHLQEVSE